MKSLRPVLFLFAGALVLAVIWMIQNYSRHPSAPHTGPGVSLKQGSNGLKAISQDTPITRNPPIASAVEKAETQKKLQILTEIFRSKNDNDPRLDHDFNQLSLDTKHAIEHEYEELKVENRNERGTVIFLLGRNLASKEDFDFLTKVVDEPPCLSLGDCKASTVKANSANSANSNEDPDGDLGSEVTLEYPQIVALKSIEHYLADHPGSSYAMDVLKEAMKSKAPLVSHLASDLAHKYEH